MAEASKEISVFWRTYSRFSTLSRVIWWKATSPVGKSLAPVTESGREKTNFSFRITGGLV